MARALAVLSAFAGVAAWILCERRLGAHYGAIALLLAVAIGALMRRAVHDERDQHLPLQAGLLALFAMMLGEFLTLRALSQPFESWTVLWWGAGGFAAHTLTRHALLTKQIAAADDAALDERRGDGRARARRARSRTRSRGGARISCELCEQLVDASTTTATAHGIVCPRCKPRAGEARIACGACDAFVDPATTSSHAQYGIVCDGCLPRLARRVTTGVGRVRCEVCDELVDAATTSGFDKHSIVCEACYQELEVGPNRDATFR